MAENIPQNLDLAQILATLASLPQSEAQPSQDQQQPFNPSDGGQGYQTFQQQYNPAQVNFHQQLADPRLAGRPTQHRHPAPKPQERVSSPVIDPSTITEWKQGLRCMSKIAAQNPEFAPTVRKLMKDQELAVKSWEAGRKNLIEEQKIKRENERTHRAALSLPGLLSTPPLRTPECEKKELDEYDAKVYRASKAMVDSQTSSLKVLGVPFFGVKTYLVSGSTYDPAKIADPQSVPTSAKITKEQLLELQRRMLNHLMELYGD
ncbi:ATP synthase subunit beta [Pyrenophora seminiperda CCB06]|uniref:ATP synthase subunit beta n=1 Tax=Pyrenophora seminiperda CCB06 TaxID=1302712 RepID=A0A3M7MBF5_9PLEO|nr:ATP synthase subunit beta [Pyrenophora seminiperda CCB06]